MPPKAAPERARAPDRTRLILIVTCLAFVLIVGLGVMRARGKARQTERARSTEESIVYNGRPAPEPLAPSASARRVVRWCEALGVLQAKCQRCHTSPPRNGAPIAMLTYADTQREYPPGTGELVFQRMNRIVRLHGMPPLGLPVDPPVEPLDALEKDILLVWLEEGALPFGGEDCAKIAPPAPGEP
jgi:hypothetical protein